MTINSLRFLKRSNLQYEQKLYTEYFRDLINSYGIDVKYFRKDLRFFSNISGKADMIYGDDTTASFYLSAPMVVFMQMNQESFLLNKYGIETNSDSNIFFTVEDFTEQFTDLIGTPTISSFITNISGSITNLSGVLEGTFFNDDITGSLSSNISSITSGIISGSIVMNTSITNNPVNQYIKNIHYYDYGVKSLTGNLSGVYSGSIDISGNGILTGIASGSLEYFKKISLNHGNGFKIAPQVGDFFRIDYTLDNPEEYEITQIIDRHLASNGISPILGKYIWQCECVRRDPSYEDVIGPSKEEPNTTDKKFEASAQNIISKEIFNYGIQEVDNIDKKDADSIYGNF